MLIELGLKSLVDSLIVEKPKKVGRKWTKAQTAKFKATMKKKFWEDTNAKK
jgi:hypothetical protein